MRKNKNGKKNKVVDLTNSIEPVQHNPGGFKNRLKPRSKNQQEYIRTIAENNITLCHGVAGSGKTHIAIGMAIEYLLEQKVGKIVITRPVVESGEKIGYLPGTAEEKLHPYLLPILDEIHHFISTGEYNSHKANNRIEVVPLGLMRGRNFHNTFIVADECQNASYDQLKMLLTRIGMNSKMILTGDNSQSDLTKMARGGFETITDALTELDGVGISKLDYGDIVRHPIIEKILVRLDSIENYGKKS